MNPGIGLDSFYPTTAGLWAGGGGPEWQAAEQLYKSLAAGSVSYNFGSVAAGNGAPLRTESVEGTIRLADFLVRHLKLYTRIAKQRAEQIEHQWVERSEYGQSAVSTLFDGISTPTFTDMTDQRRSVKMKFRSTGRAVTPQMRTVNVIGGDPVAQEMVAGTMFMLRDIELSSYFGNENVDPLEVKGIEQQITDALLSVIPTRITDNDLRGAALAQSHIETASTSAAGLDAWGMINELHLALRAMSKFNNTFSGNGTLTNGIQRVGLQGERVIGAGTVATSQVTTASEVTYVPNAFLDARNVRVTSWNVKNPSGLAGLVPASPTVGAPASGAATARGALEDPGLPTSQFTAANGYFYWVAAVGRGGASAAVQANVVAVSSVSTQNISISVTPNGANAPVYYIVFRTRADDTDATKARAIMWVQNTAGAGAMTIIDRNDRIPGCTTGFALEMVPENIALLETLPLSRTPLYDQSLLTKWALVQFGTPVVRLARHCNILRNIDTEY